jgi:hypothetical protein
MPLKTHLPCGAEDAPHRAARLRGDAQRYALRIAHFHRFDLLSICEAEGSLQGLPI